MNEFFEHGESNADRRLGDWLREATDPELSGIAGHVAKARLALLERLEAASPAEAHPTQRIRLRSRLASLIARHRLALGSIGVTMALAVVLVLVALNSGERLSAMERIAKELREVTSYSYHVHWQTAELDERAKHSTTWKGDGTTCWRAPDAFHYDMKIVKIDEDVPTGKRTETVLEHFAEIYPQGKPGALIDYEHKTFIRVNYDPTGSKIYPDDALRMIREGSYDVKRDLGTKQIGAAKARGYVLVLKNAHTKNAVHDPVELWVDVETNLPIQFSYGGKNEGSVYSDLMTDFRWNIELDQKLFDPTPAAGCDDISPPKDENDLAQIAAALRLYGELSGGQHPQAKPFKANGIHEEMKKMAGFDGPAQPDWASNPKYLQIEKAVGGLNWIERILRNRFSAGYRGMIVGPAEKDKVLLWWTDSKDRYRVYYGDLRSDVITEAQWEKLIPADERDPK